MGQQDIGLDQRQREERGAVGDIQRQPRDWWGDEANIRGWEKDWAMHIFLLHNKEADAWAEKGLKERNNWEDEEGVVWQDAQGFVGFGMAGGMGGWEGWVDSRERRIKWRKMRLPTMAEKVWKAAREGEDWVQDMTKNLPQKEEVVVAS